MAITTIYKCDKCGAEQTDNKQFWTVGIIAYHMGSAKGDPKLQMEVCRPCLESFGIHVTPKPENKDNPPVVPTIEELICEIVNRCTN